MDGLIISLLKWMLCFTLLSMAAANCTWYGQCGQNPTKPAYKVNCEYHGDAKPLNTTKSIKEYRKLCPDIFQEQGTNTCCSDNQMDTLSEQVGQMIPLFSRCPSCLKNTLNLWCYMTCAANMSNFVAVNKTVPYHNKTFSGNAILSVDYYTTHEFAFSLFDSCKDVVFPTTGQTVIDTLCGVGCTPQRWLDFLGSQKNAYAPFQINFHITDHEIPPVGNRTRTLTPLNATTVPCDKPSSIATQKCSCQDCKASCTGPPIPPVPKTDGQCEVFHINCYSFAFSVVFATFLLIFGCYSICYNIMVQDSLRMETCNIGYPDSSVWYSRFLPEIGPSATRNERKIQYLENIDEDQLSFCETHGARTEAFLERMFGRWGMFCASRPFVVIGVVLVLCGILIGGVALFDVTTDPVKLWSAPTSTARNQKDYFDSHFGPFYRTEQIIISLPHDNTIIEHDKINYTGIFNKTFLHHILDLQLQIENLTAEHDGKSFTLEDICFAPLSPDNNNCTIQSVLNYFQNSHSELDKKTLTSINYLDHITYCADNPESTQSMEGLEMTCLGTYGGPVFPWVAMGGFKDAKYETSQALVITFVVNNHLDKDKNGPAEAWETKYIEFMKNYILEHPGINIAFRAERSIEDEINRESKGDIITILVSYIIMFVYITFTLGQYQDCQQFLLDAKVSLGLSGVIIVLLSVGASLGFYSYLGIPSTLIIIEVVPFLVLAVGVDNIFIVVQTYQREPRWDGESTEHVIARVVSKVGPSMLLTSMSESLAFFLGALTSMPAVKVFSLYAAMAVLIDFLLQISIFISLLTLDAKRQEAKRLDMCCCVETSQHTKRSTEGGLLYKLFKKYYSKFLLKEYVRPIVMVVFVGYFCASGAMIPHIGIGLDQSLSMPKDSYVLSYFKNLNTYLSVGPPVYFVVRKGENYSNYDVQNGICGISGCPQNSLAGQISRSSLQPKYSYIAHPVTSWIDDYFAWATSTECCRYFSNNGSFCPSTDTVDDCLPCVLHNTKKGRPVGDDFDKYLPWFLKDNPNVHCSKGGHAAYSSAVSYYDKSRHQKEVGATYFMTYHTILKTSEDYIEALKEARKIAENISISLKHTSGGEEHTVFPYSIFYVFYEQYLTIVHDSAMNLSICLAAILVITFFLLGLDLYSAVIVVVTIIMIVVDMMGLMYLWDISLNALSLVNLIMTIGISVEFCSHIIRAFAVNILPTRKERAIDALSHMGSSVLSGITLTKLGGIIVLAFSKSQLFQVFYFRMYLGIVVFGATHGLIFLPVLLSYVGPPVNKAKYYQHKQKEVDSESDDTRNLPDPFHPNTTSSTENGTRNTRSSINQ